MVAEATEAAAVRRLSALVVASAALEVAAPAAEVAVEDPESVLLDASLEVLLEPSLELLELLELAVAVAEGATGRGTLTYPMAGPATTLESVIGVLLERVRRA